MRNSVTFENHKKKLLSDPEVRKHYDALKPEYMLIRSIIDKRIKSKLSQASLARKVGTKQSAISRLESGTANPSIGFLKKVASALDSSLEITLQSR